jgi:putative aldouronate transport system substrate-binding protein
MLNKRWAAVAAAIVIGAGAAWAEGAEETASAEGRLEAVGFNEGGYPIVDETVTVHALIQRPGHVTSAFDEQTLLIEMQERTNVDIVFEEVPQAQVREKTNLLFASREFPDVIFVAGVQDRLLWDAAQAGDVWPLNDLVEQYAPNWQKGFEERPVIRNAITMPDGKFYSLPYYREILNDFGIRDIQAINVDWLNTMGLEMPQTTEELYETLKAFRTGIDSGTLPKDGIPWYFRFHQWVGGEFEIYNAFGLWMKGQGSGAQRYLSVNDGVVEFGAADPKLKDVVNYMHRLFVEDLIPEEVFTDAWDDYLAKSRSVPPITGMWGSYFIVSPVEEWYDPLPPVAGPDGTQRFRSQPVRLQKNQFTIFSKFEYPEALVRFIDPWADDTFSVEASYGGPLIRQESDGTRTVTGRGVDWFEHGPHNFFPTYVSKRAADKVNWTGEQGNRDLYIREIYEPYLWPQERHFAYITYTDEEQEELAVTSTEIANYIQTSIANWMVDGGVEDGWEDYLNELDRLGLDKVMEIFQTAYDRFHGN